jgi:phosphoribosylamine--glycine ligase
MKLMVIGAGGREHALAWRLSKSPRVQKVFVAPGNGGTAAEPDLENVALDTVKDPDGLIRFLKDNDIAFAVVGPEAPLAAGLVDQLESEGLKVFGPCKAAAQLEASKDFAKQFMAKYNIPTAGYQTFTDASMACDYATDQAKRFPGLPIVIKADGLAAGKGVVVAASVQEAHQAIKDMLTGNKLGSAGARVVIEDFLQGEEASFMVVCDGKSAFALATSQDHKRIGDGDTGPNTGGMGAYSPAPVVTPKVYAQVMREVIRPVLKGMQAEGTPYKGFLYAGLMIQNDQAKVVEFNCRMGDPETQPIMMRMKGDFASLLEAAIHGRLEQAESMADNLWDGRPAVGVVLAAANYPDTPQLGDLITGLPKDTADTKVFHAGTALAEKDLVTSGGRVLCVTALGGKLKDAQASAYQTLGSIKFNGMQYRKDVAAKGVG